jgi:cell division septation protein DedD
MKNKDYRELQISSSVLIFIFIGVIIVGIVIFLLGVSVGKKQATAAGIPATPQSQFEEVVAEKPKPTGEDKDPISQELEGHQVAQKETSQKPEEVTRPEVKTKSPVEKPAPAKTTPPPAKTSASPGGSFFLQIGAFRNRESADAVVEKYRSMGFPGQVIVPAAGDSRQLFRVVLGGYNTRSDAERSKAQLVETEGQKASEYFIVRR